MHKASFRFVSPGIPVRYIRSAKMRKIVIKEKYYKRSEALQV